MQKDLRLWQEEAGEFEHGEAEPSCAPRVWSRTLFRDVWGVHSDWELGLGIDSLGTLAG